MSMISVHERNRYLNLISSCSFAKINIHFFKTSSEVDVHVFLFNLDARIKVSKVIFDV